MTVAPTRIKPQNGVSRDVQDELARQRAEKRRQAGGVSPVQFHKDLLVGDDWNCQFIKKISLGVSMHEFSEPPQTVLDLGCGSGLWVIEAAKSWSGTDFVGFDLRDVQPDLTQANLGIEYRDLSKRIKWAHGDFLEPLPFESDHFDLVRICCIGLEVPEDSWQELLEECYRILKPGGVLEVIEEDLLFPAGRTRLPEVDRRSNVRTVSIRRASGERNRSDSTASKLTTLTTQSQSSASTSSMVFTTDRISQSVSIDSTLSSSSRADSTQDLFAQDHAKLKRAWEEMLGQRFLTHKLLTVLPFYISSLFSQVQVHPTMSVLLPPPSSLSSPAFELDAELESEDENEAHLRWLEAMRSGAVQLNGPASRKESSAALRQRPPVATVKKWNKLHLARQVRLITACKEAIWQAYQTLDVEDEGGYPARGEPPKDELRDEFDRNWEDWEEDMKDRMGVRGHMSQLNWKDPDGDSLRPGSVHSSKAQSKRGRQSLNPGPDTSDPDSAALCRAMRGLTARKPMHE